MEPECSLPHSQVPATCHYPEPVPYIYIYACILFHGATAPSGPWPPHYRGFTITLLWASDQPDAETSP
jgi:hypothetical protein